MGRLPLRVLAVDDYEPWRDFVSRTLLNEPELHIIASAADGLEAVEKAEQLQPDLVLLDIGLPTFNGIEASRRIRQVSPASKILFVSDNSSAEIAELALSTGGLGYVVKSAAASELVPAIDAVSRGKRFLSSVLALQGSRERTDEHGPGVAHRHEVAFYPNDDALIDGYARFIESALQVGNAVIVVMTESHRARLVPRLETEGVDVPSATKRGTYVPLDVMDAILKMTIDGMPDPVRCEKVISDLIEGTAKNLREECRQVVACGEIAPTLLSKGNAEGAIRLEHLWDEITRPYGVNTLCGYIWNASLENNAIFERICAEHSEVHGKNCATDLPVLR